MLAGSPQTEPRAGSAQPENHGANQQSADLWEILQGLSAPIVAFFTLVLMCVGWGQLRAISRQADIAERAIIAADRPFVFAEVSDPGFEIRWVEPIKQQVFSGKRFELRLFNLGHTPALLTRLEYEISTASRGSIAAAIDPQEIGGREMPVGIAVTTERNWTEGTLMNSALTEAQKADAANFRASLWLVGFVRYDDLLGGHYITGFSQVYDPIGMHFVTRGDRQYNYARSEKAEEIPPPSSRG